MGYLEIAKEMIRRHEGLRQRPYKDSKGKWTVGYGHNIDDRGWDPIAPRPLTKGISWDEVMALLDADVIVAEKDARGLCPSFDSLTDIRMAVLIDMSFNLGLERLSGFKRMLWFVSQHGYRDAAREILASKYASDVKTRAIENAKNMADG